MPSKHRQGSTLSERDWNFSGVAPDEAPYCLYYEFGRSADGFKEGVAAWRQRNPQVCEAASRLMALVKPKEQYIAASAKAFQEAWHSFIKASWFGSKDAMYPGGLSHTDHRPTLYYFPCFPDVPWQDIGEPIRKTAFFLLNPNTYLAQLHLPGAGAIQSPQTAQTIAAQRTVQKHCRSPMSEQQLAQSARHQMNDHVFAPPLVEAPHFGMVPTSARFEKDGKQVWAEGFCREGVSFVLNWAWGDDELLEGFKKWLKTPGRRPHKRFQHWKTTNPREHLKKLGAFRILKAGVSAYQAAQHYGIYENPKQYLKAKGEAGRLLETLFSPGNT